MTNADAASHFILGRLEYFPILYNGSLGCGAAHVQRHQVGYPQAIAQMIGPDHPGGRA